MLAPHKQHLVASRFDFPMILDMTVFIYRGSSGPGTEDRASGGADRTRAGGVREELTFRSGLRSGDQLRGADGLKGSNRLGNERRLLFDDGVVDGGAEAFVQDLDAEQFCGCSCTVLVRAGDGDVEGQDLIGVPGKRMF
jgi:hypothetical protein